MSNNKKLSGLFGKGYYIALILCAAAIGISGYLYYRNANKTQEVINEPEVQQTVIAGATEENTPVSATGPQELDPDTQVSAGVTIPEEKLRLKTAAPVSGTTIADYAMECLSYNETTRDWRTHNGVDIAAEAGTPVCAAADGTVYTTYTDDVMGTTVVIRHEGGYVTTYASLAEELTVSPGDSVKLGQTIGTVGATALIESAIGDHVHFGVTCNGEAMDPAKFFALSN